MLLDLLLFPFHVIWAVATLAWKVFMGAFTLFFGLLGSVWGILKGCAVIALIGGLISMATHRRRAY